MTNLRTTHYIFGSTVGPHPYPMIVRDFQSVIGREARAQILEAEGRLPDLCIACVDGGSNAMGLFHEFLDDAEVALVGVEAAGDGVDTERHAATMALGSYGVFHGSAMYLLQDAEGQVHPTHSISAGLDYPGVGPEHCALRDAGRASYALGHRRGGRGRLPGAGAPRRNHPGPRERPRRGARAQARPRAGARRGDGDQPLGRGDKDCEQVAKRLGIPL